MQAQLRQGGRFALRYLGGRGLRGTDRQQRRVDAHHLTEQLPRATARPTLAEADPGRLVPTVPIHVPRIDSLLEQGHAGFMPQGVAEQAGRIGPYRQRQRRHQLDGVIGVCKVCRIDPVMHLERGIGALQGNVRHIQLQRVVTVDVDPEGIAAPLYKLLDQGVVAPPVGNTVWTKVGLPQGGQYTDRHNTCVPRRCHFTQARQLRQYFRFGSGKRPVADGVGRQVVLEVVAIELQRQLRIIGSGQDLLVQMRWPALGVDDIHLQFRTEGGGAAAEARGLRQLTQGIEVFLQPGLKRRVVLRGKTGFIDLYTHGCPVWDESPAFLLIDGNGNANGDSVRVLAGRHRDGIR